MAVYIDNFNAPYGRMIMCHMVEDTSAELLEMARKIGVNKKWIQYPGTYNEHFDVCLQMKKNGISLGAIEIGFREYAEFCNKRLNQNGLQKKRCIGDILHPGSEAGENSEETTGENKTSQQEAGRSK